MVAGTHPFERGEEHVGLRAPQEESRRLDDDTAEDFELHKKSHGAVDDDTADDFELHKKSHGAVDDDTADDFELHKKSY